MRGAVTWWKNWNVSTHIPTSLVSGRERPFIRNVVRFMTRYRKSAGTCQVTIHSRLWKTKFPAFGKNGNVAHVCVRLWRHYGVCALPSEWKSPSKPGIFSVTRCFSLVKYYQQSRRSKGPCARAQGLRLALFVMSGSWCLFWTCYSQKWRPTEALGFIHAAPFTFS